MLPANTPYLIGETALHHEGNIEFLKDLIEAGIEIKVDALKFHITLDLDDYMIQNHEAIEVIRPWCIGADEWSVILPEVRAKGIDLILLCNDVASLIWVNDSDIEVAAIEIHATGLNDFFLLTKAAEFDGTVILGTGGSTIDEIQFAIDFLKSNGKQDIFLMHGFQNYPTDYKDINLSKMQLLKDLFELPVGYADHTDPMDSDNETISVMAAAMGFNVLEKHFTHKFGEKRIDAQAAVSEHQMNNIKRLLGKALKTNGSKKLNMSDAEKKYGDTGPMKKAVVARRKIKKGEKIVIEDLAFKRTNKSSTMKQMDFQKLIGLTVKNTIQRDEIIDYTNVEYVFQKTDISQFQSTNK